MKCVNAFVNEHTNKCKLGIFHVVFYELALAVSRSISVSESFRNISKVSDF